jgi:Na+-driven multidrug efflux pump
MKFLFASSLLALSQGFVPQRPLSTRLYSNSRPYEQPVKEAEETEEPGFVAPIEGPDLGKEIFLSNLKDNSQVVTATGTIDTVVVDAIESTLSDVQVTECVNAILAASEEAAVAAEASLPAEFADKLDIQNVDAPLVDVLSFVEPVEASVLEILPDSSVAGFVVGEKATAEKFSAPGVSKILKFAVPAIGVWLCGPLLSLIDTSAVGLLSGTTQQAALNPAVAVTDYAALLIAFLYTATTNLMAAARETDRGVEGMPRTTKTFIGAIQLSTFVGAGLGAVLFTFARPLLRTIIGNDSINPAVFAAAMKYVRIRALGMPAAAVIGSSQAACLGMQDIRSPLYVLGVAAVVNFFGDMLFVGNAHPLIGGAAGAAWATVFSQYAAVTMFIHWLTNKPKPEAQQPTPAVNVSKAILELTGKPSSEGESRRKRFRDALRSFRNPTILPKAVEAEPEEMSFSARGFLQGRFRGRQLLKIPSKEVMNEFSEYLVPVTSQQVGRVSGYVAMSHVVSSSMGIMSMAAQQVIVSFFYCLCPIADSLSLTAQSFLPAIIEKKASPKRAEALRKTVLNFGKAGAIFGLVMLSAVSCIPLLSQFFTADLAVVSLVNMITPLLIAFFAVHGVLCAMEGVLLGRKDLNFLGKMYAGFFAVVPFFMLRVKRAALAKTPGVNLSSVWKVFLCYQLFRTVVWTGRVAILQRRTDKQAEAIGQAP